MLPHVIMSENKTNTCRVCLKSNNSDYIDLESGTKWLELYEYCFGLTINENDVPRKLCSKCAECTQAFADFKRKCSQSDQLWRSIIRHNLDESIKMENEIILSDVKKEEVMEEEMRQDMEEEMKIDTEENNVSLECSEIDVKPENYDLDEPSAINSNYGKALIPVKPKNKVTRKYKKHRKKAIKKVDTKTNSAGIVEIPCGICDFISSNTELLKLHLEIHIKNNDLNCKLCSYEGRDFADMILHRFDHLPEDKELVKIRVCCVCNQTFPLKSKLANFKRCLEFHYRSVHLNKNGGWCGVCNKTFSQYKPYWNHLQMHDENKKKYICDNCGKVFLYRCDIEAHLHKKKNICDICGKSYTRRSYLKAHLSTVHENVPVKCNHCTRMFKNEHRLKEHLKFVAKDKEYVCKICSKAFGKSRDLKIHEFWHTGERPYPCEICEKKYKNKSQLVVHLKRHRGIREFKCSHCPKVFVTNTQKKVHESIHTGVRRHKCMHCDRSFNHRKEFVVHCSKKHNVDVDSKSSQIKTSMK